MRFLLIFVSFCSFLFAQNITLSQLAYMASQQSKTSIVFDKNVDSSLSVFLSPSDSLDYLPLFTSVLRANGLNAFRAGNTIIVGKDDVNENINVAGGQTINDFKRSGKLRFDNNVSSNDRYVLGGSPTVGYSYLNHSRDSNTSVACKDCVYEPVPLQFLNESDLEGFLKFSGAKYDYVKNINTLVFERPKDDNSTVKRVFNIIKSLDVPKSQVQIRITIFDVSKNTIRDIGNNASVAFDLSYTKTNNVLSGSAVPNFIASLKFLESHALSNVTTYPTFLVSNLDKMTFNSVLNIPFLDENYALTTTSVSQTKKYKYKPIGFKADITPTIVGDVVYLDFSLSYESVVSSGDLPTTSEKSIKNKFMLKKGDILLISGLEKETKLGNQEGLPFIQSIPVLKYLFSHENNNNTDDVFNVAVEVLNDP